MDERAPSAIDRKIGMRVRARRLELGMSQEQLAGLLRVTFQQVQKYERGVNRIAASRLFDLSRALDLPIADFFFDLNVEAEEDSPATLSEALSTPGAHELLQLYANLRTAKLRRHVLQLVRVLNEE